MTYVATYTVPQLSATAPVIVDGSDNVKKTFSSWTQLSGYFPSGSHIAFYKKNTNSVSYSSSNAYYLKQGYMVGNQDYMAVGWHGDNMKLKLGH